MRVSDKDFYLYTFIILNRYWEQKLTVKLNLNKYATNKYHSWISESLKR